ncbi:phosphotransferase family protein [Actinomycetospora flava]|uniref:Phosphotransferase family protein n=1 Tax=Actinomycetospora flava TaxID=3129232 RepID=A0ABU8MEN5_9PSEU
MTVPRTAPELAPALVAVLGGGEVTELRRLSAGASRETWTFALDGRRLVLRRDPPGAPRPVEMAREAECLRAAARAGVPVPCVVRSSGGGDAVGTPYLVMEHVDGESLPGRLLRDERWASARVGLARELGRVLARIHALDPQAVPSLPLVPDPLGVLRARYDAFGEPQPGLDVAFRWLAEHRPPPVAPAVVHGDFRNGNLLVAPDGLAAVLDWELAHRGDPREDLGWLCARAWRFGAEPAVGGFGSREELLAGYAEVAGTSPEAEAVRWWEIYGCVHWAVICRIQAERHLGGTERSMELAVLGRRAVEAEYDALLALGVVSPADAVVPVPAAPAAPGTSRPTVDELLEAVSGFLTDELVAGDDRSRYLAKVARNALGIVRRELASPDPDGSDLGDRLRAGALDPDEPAVADAVRSSVLTRLAVANPRYGSAR